MPLSTTDPLALCPLRSEKEKRAPRECVIFRVQGKFIGGAEQFAPLLF